MLDLKKLEKRVAELSWETESVVHDFGHFKRVADGSVWFCKLLDGGKEEQEIAYAASLLHDIVRPPSEKIDPLKAAMDESEVILKGLGVDKATAGKILKAIYAHHHPDEDELAGLAVFLADKVLEQSGAYIIIRRLMYIGESPDFAGMSEEKGIIFHFQQRMKKYSPEAMKSLLPALYRKFAPLIEHQFKWQTWYFDAYVRGDTWAREFGHRAYNAGKRKAEVHVPAKGRQGSLEAFTKKLAPKTEEEERIKREVLEYLAGRKLPAFAGMVR